jgi:type I restriction enzyme R subunit
VHFAVSQSEVMMSTRLAGTATTFLPFNQGNAGGAGNPPNPFGFATWYLWQEVWQRDSWLEILGRYLVGERDDKKQLTGVIFPATTSSTRPASWWPTCWSTALASAT